MNTLSLCSGIGGMELGLSLVTDHETICWVEQDRYCQDLLLARMADGLLDRAPLWPDIRTLSGEMVDNIASPWQDPCWEERTMGARRKDYDQAVSLYEGGLSLAEIADFYQIGRQAMWKILQRRGVAFRGQKRYGSENHFFRGGRSGKGRANDLFERALLKGLVLRRNQCERCSASGSFKDGRSLVQAHHDDYNRPLDVRWLCQPCHHEWHKNNKPIQKNKENQVEAAKVIDVVTGGFP